MTGKPIRSLQLCASEPAQERCMPRPRRLDARPLVTVRARIAPLLVLIALTPALAPTAQAQQPTAQTAAKGGGVSANDIPPRPATTGGSQAGKPSARQTRLVLARAARSLGRRSLRRGARGAEVKTLQLVLTTLGYRVRPTAFFTRATEYQVKRFQKAWRIDVIGIVGPATGAALRSALDGGKPPPAPPIPPPPAPVSVDGWVFPVRGPHSYGNGDNRFGAARSGHSHAGQDIMAPCGTPLAAARGGKVVGAGYGGGAGYYVAVDTADTRYDYFYAHLRTAPLVNQGATVQTGQIVGYVGDTGHAWGCHLHFELWDGPWWNGGHAIDPLATLQAWDRR